MACANKLLSLLNRLSAGLQPHSIRLPHPAGRALQLVQRVQLAATSPTLKHIILECDGCRVGGYVRDGERGGGVLLGREDFSRLRDEGQNVVDHSDLYLNDTCIDGWAGCLNNTSKEVFMFTSTLTKMFGQESIYLKEEEEDDWKLKKWITKWSKEENWDGGVGFLFHKRSWVLPYQAEQHWTTVVVDFETRTIVHMDSLAGYSEDKAQNTKDIIRRLYRIAYPESSLDLSGWAKGGLRNLSPCQLNYFDCGLFPIIIARSLHHKCLLPSTDWLRDKMGLIRRLVVWELLQGRILSTVDLEIIGNRPTCD